MTQNSYRSSPRLLFSVALIVGLGATGWSLSTLFESELDSRNKLFSGPPLNDIVVAQEDTCMMSLCIPCIPTDFPTLNISLRTHFFPGYKFPDELILAVSSFDKDKHQQLLENVAKAVKEWSGDFTRVIFSTTPEQHYAGVNRNRAMKLSTCRYVTFFDSDDFASPGRIEALLYFFDRHPDLAAIYHRFSKDHTVPDPVAETEWLKSYKNAHLARTDTFFLGLTEVPRSRKRMINMHRGWPTVRRAELTQNPNMTWPDYQRAQDYAFVTVLADYLPNRQIGLVWLILGHYFELGRDDIVANKKRGTLFAKVIEEYKSSNQWNLTRETLERVVVL